MSNRLISASRFVGPTNAVRRLIEEVRLGRPNYDLMSSALARVTPRQSLTINVPYVLLLVVVVVAVDVLFFRNRFWPRLMVNIGIILIFAAFYSRSI